MTKEIHLIIIGLIFLIYFVYKNAKKFKNWLLNNYGELKTIKLLVYFLPSIICSGMYISIDYSKPLYYNTSLTICLYASFLLLLYFIYEFSDYKEDITLPSGLKINSLKLFRSLRNEKLLEGKYSDFMAFLNQEKKILKINLKCNDFEGNRFIYKKILALTLLCFNEPNSKYNELKTAFFKDKLEPYFVKSNNSELNITDDNISKLRITEDKNYIFMKGIFDKCIS